MRSIKYLFLLLFVFSFLLFFSTSNPSFAKPKDKSSMQANNEALLEAAEQDNLNEVRQLLAAGADANYSDESGHSPLAEASYGGNVEIVRALLAAGARPNPRDRRNDDNPLMRAIDSGEPEVARILIQAGADVNAKRRDGTFPLYLAVRGGQREIVQDLLRAGVRLETERHGETSLLAALGKRDEEMVKLLIAAGADVNANRSMALAMAIDEGDLEMVRLLIRSGVLVNAKFDNKMTPLMMAALYSRPAMVNELLKAGANPKAKFKGMTAEMLARENDRDRNADAIHLCKFGPLLKAAAAGHYRDVAALIQQGADVNAKDRDGKSALMYAIGYHDWDIARALIQAGADTTVAAKDGKSILFAAIEEKNTELALLLIDNSRAKNLSGTAGLSPLLPAVASSNVKVIEALLRAGVDPNVAGGEGKTPLHLAAEKGQAPIVTILIQAGAAIEAVDWSRRTPLLEALIENRTDTAKLLLGSGADIHARDEDGDTPLLVAVNRGNAELVRILLDAGAEVNVQGRYGFTPLILTPFEGQYEIFEMLLAAGAKLDAQDSDGSTALLTAASFKESWLVGKLVEAGANVKLADNRGRTALMELADWDEGKTPKQRKGSPPKRMEDGKILMRMLLAAGSDVQARNDEGESALSIAAAGHPLWKLKMLVKAGADVRAVNKEGNTPLGLAAAAPSLENVKFLLGSGAPLEARNKEGNTALLMTAANVVESWYRDEHEIDLAVLQTLIEAGADLQARNNQGDSAFSKLLGSKEQRVLSMVVAAVPEPAVVGKIPQDDPWASMPPLHRAILYGRTTEARRLMADDADINATDARGRSALTLAAIMNRREIAQALIEAGTSTLREDVETPLLAAIQNQATEVALLLIRSSDLGNLSYYDNSPGSSFLRPAITVGNATVVRALLESKPHSSVLNNCLQDAAALGNLPIVRMLLAAGANPAADRSDSALVRAATEGHLEVVRELVQGDIDSSTLAQAQDSAVTGGHWEMIELFLAKGGKDAVSRALVTAAGTGNTQLARKLLGLGADIDYDQGAPLRMAVAGGSLETISMVLEAGASKFENIGLTKAIEDRRLDIVKLLLRSGVDPNVMDDPYSHTPPLWSAVHNNYPAIAVELIRAGAEVDRSSEKVWDTYLMDAASLGYTDMVRLLIEAGAPIDVRNTRNETALDIARDNEHLEVAALIEAIDAAGQAVKLADSNSWAFADNCEGVARKLLRSEEYFEAERLFKRALDARERMLGPENQNLIAPMVDLGSMYMDQGDVDKAEQTLTRALSIMRKNLKPDHEDVLAVLEKLQSLYDGTGRGGKTDDLYAQWLANMISRYGPELDIVVATLDKVAARLDKQQHSQTATNLYRQWLAEISQRRVLKGADPAKNLAALGGTFCGEQKYEKAFILLNRALEMLDTDHPDKETAMAVNALGVVQFHRRFSGSKCVDLFELSLKFLRQSVGPDSPEEGLVYFNRNYVNVVWQFQSDPEHLFTDALPIWEKAFGADQPRLSQKIIELARSADDAGQIIDAKTLIEWASDLKNHPDQSGKSSLVTKTWRGHP
jgi:ankyrin repeat protein